jgi:hypothetical protein
MLWSKEKSSLIRLQAALIESIMSNIARHIVICPRYVAFDCSNQNKLKIMFLEVLYDLLTRFSFELVSFAIP